MTKVLAYLLRTLSKGVPVVALGVYASIYRSHGNSEYMDMIGNLLLGVAVVVTVQMGKRNVWAAVDAANKGAHSLWTDRHMLAVLTGLFCVIASAALYQAYNPYTDLSVITEQCHGLTQQQCQEFQQVYKAMWPEQSTGEPSPDYLDKKSSVKMSAIITAVFLVISAVIHPLVAMNDELQTNAELKKDKMRWVTAPSLLSVYVLALWVGWVHTTTQRLRLSMMVQMVEQPAYQSTFSHLARRMQWLQFYVLVGFIAIVYALTHLRMMGDTLLLYVFVFSGFSIISSLYYMYNISERWQPIVEMLDPAAEQQALKPTDKSNAAVEGVALMVLTLLALCIASVRANRSSTAWKVAECVVLPLAFVLVLAFSDVSHMMQGSTHFAAVGMAPVDPSKIRAWITGHANEDPLQAAGAGAAQ